MSSVVDRPIGILDSGIGGLTVAQAIIELLPRESLLYFGDTAHMPYGDRPPAAIQGYVRKIADFFLEQKVKLIVVACNTAVAAAYPMLADYLAGRVMLLNVVDPLVEFLGEYYRGKRVGLIGTSLTVNSKIYPDKLAQMGVKLELESLATPLLVPIIEGNWFAHLDLLKLVVHQYLAHPSLQKIDALALGCTHYPIIREPIAAYYQGASPTILDSAQITAQKTVDLLVKTDQLANGPARYRCYLSEEAENFTAEARQRLNDSVEVITLKNF